jgi:hypothetical protein
MVEASTGDQTEQAAASLADDQIPARQEEEIGREIGGLGEKAV